MTLRAQAALGFAASAIAAALVVSGLGGAAMARAAAVPLVLAAIAGPSLGKHPFPSLGPANLLTLARGALIGACAGVVEERYAWVLVFANGAAFMLDWLDGRVARASGMASPFGARLDMELDAIAILVMSLQVWWLGRAGAWVVLSGALRYAFVAAAYALPWMDRPLFPAPRRAWVCGVQVTCLIGAIVPWPVPGLAAATALFGLVALIGSFGADTAWLVRHRHDPLPGPVEAR